MMLKIRLKFWIFNLASIVKSIKENFLTWKSLTKEFVTQKMAALPEKTLKPSVEWQHTSIDLFGPYPVRRT